MAKKINCKDGLDYKEELQARKMRWRLEEREEEAVQYVKDLYAEWYVKPQAGFLQWVYTTKSKVLASALKRMDDWTMLLI